MSSSKADAPRQAPPPRAATPYSRFIPREELQGFASWRPDSFGDAPASSAVRARREADGESAATEAQREAQLRAQVQAARQSGYEDGYRDGLVALENFKESYARQASAQIGALIAAFDREFAAIEQQIAASLSRIAVQLARQVVRTELTARPQIIARVAEEALDAVLASARRITVQLHPQDLPLVAEGAADALAARGARLVAQAAIERGGCLVESDAGSVDARIATRWDEATRALGGDAAWTAP